jgi:hypothetical protein
LRPFHQATSSVSSTNRTDYVQQTRVVYLFLTLENIQKRIIFYKIDFSSGAETQNSNTATMDRRSPISRRTHWVVKKR